MAYDWILKKSKPKKSKPEEEKEKINKNLKRRYKELNNLSTYGFVKNKRESKRKVQPFRRNWDVDCFNDIINGNGFYITEPATVSFDGTKEKSLYGPQSPLFGTDYSDEQAFAERFRCKCGNMKSRLFEGEICPICKTKVEARTTNINMFGWIPLGKDKVINPYYYKLLQKACGTKVFDDIVTAKYKVTKNGQKEELSQEDFDESPSSPYAYIGIDQFRLRFDEIMLYFANTKKAKRKAILNLIKSKNAIFTSHIPVFTTLLRPQSVTSDTFYFETVDKLINTMVTLSQSLQDAVDIERDFILQRLQLKLGKYWDEVFQMLNGKEGHIRGQLLGGALNHTSRAVIVLDPTLKDNEIDLPYHDGRVLFKNEIIDTYMKLNDCTMAQATSAWEKSISFDQEIYDIMEMVIKATDARVLINRNPTLQYYSILLMKVRKIKSDPNDYTLAVPIGILAGLNADFDGDELNMIKIIDPSIAYMFRKFEPVRRMIIDRDTGNLNSSFAINKSQRINLYYFATLEETDNDEPEMYPDENGEYTLTEPLKKDKEEK